MQNVNWMNTIFTIIGAIVGSAVANNVPFLNDLIPIAGTSVGEILTIIVGGGIGGAVSGAIGRPST
jgi:hypothetical protein